MGNLCMPSQAPTIIFVDLDKKTHSRRLPRRMPSVPKAPLKVNDDYISGRRLPLQPPSPEESVVHISHA